MYRKPSKKKLLIQRIILFTVMTASVVIIVTGMVLFILGYRLDSVNGRLEQGALVQLDSRPNGAFVAVDGVVSGSQTATKRSVLAGEHTFTIQKDGYRPWERTLKLEAGTLTWLDYARLVPTDLSKQTVRSYTSVAGMKASPDMQSLIVQPKADTPTFEVVDIRAQDVKSTTVQLPAELLTDISTDGVTHRYEMTRWDDDGRYLLVKHIYRGTTEWIVFDTDNVAASANVTRLLGVQLTDVSFAGTNGATLYGLAADGALRKLDLQNATISRVLVSNVTSFEAYDTSVVTYVGTSEDGKKQVAGVYRDGDRTASILRTAKDADTPLKVATAKYHNDTYVVMSEGLEVSILKGGYPTPDQRVEDRLTEVRSFTATAPIDQLTMSPEGDFIVVRSGLSLVSYEVAHDRLEHSSIETSESQSRTVQWLDSAHLVATYDGHLSMRDFNGINVNVIMPVVSGLDVTLSQNGRYLYGINKTDNTYRLERVRLILN